MVKNTKGGKGAKGFARKNIADHSNKSAIRLPNDPLEFIAIVTKMYGTICDITTSSNLSLKCHIRNKFRGRSKSVSFITPHKFVLIGLRHFEAPIYKNCDLLAVYDSYDVSSLFKLPIDLSVFRSILPDLDSSLDFDCHFDDEATEPEHTSAATNAADPSTDYIPDIDNIPFDDI